MTSSRIARTLGTLACSLMLANAALAQDSAASAAPAEKPQNRMARCNQEAGDKKGDERKAFMKTCLSNAKTSQRDKMKTCNQEAGAKALKGPERRQFMSDCLKG